MIWPMANKSPGGGGRATSCEKSPARFGRILDPSQKNLARKSTKAAQNQTTSQQQQPPNFKGTADLLFSFKFKFKKDGLKNPGPWGPLCLCCASCPCFCVLPLCFLIFSYAFLCFFLCFLTFFSPKETILDPPPPTYQYYTTIPKIRNFRPHQRQHR
jgi:hypothetical protein